MGREERGESELRGVSAPDWRRLGKGSPPDSGRKPESGCGRGEAESAGEGVEAPPCGPPTSADAAFEGAGAVKWREEGKSEVKMRWKAVLGKDGPGWKKGDSITKSSLSWPGRSQEWVGQASEDQTYRCCTSGSVRKAVYGCSCRISR